MRLLKPAIRLASLPRRLPICTGSGYASFWDEYSREAHAGLARMYVEDERFRAHYDKDQPGMAAFLRDAILVYTGQNN